MSNIDESNISRYASGKMKPTLRNIGKIAAGLNVDINELVD